VSERISKEESERTRKREKERERERKNKGDSESATKMINERLHRPTKKSGLYWSIDQTYPLYFEPLNTSLKLLDLSIAYPAHLNQTLNMIQYKNFNLTTL